MEKYDFVFDNHNYELCQENCESFLNDEEYPVTGINITDILELLSQGKDISFDVEYYDRPCQKCRWGKEDKLKNFKFLEYHFCIFTKQGKYVISDISKEYDNLSYNKLLAQDKVDNSYLVSIIVCINCGKFEIEIEQCEV